MVYNASDVAKYVLKKCTDADSPISNLQLQKILYFLQRDFLKKENSPLFFDAIEAWQFGPVVPSVYYDYCAYGANEIMKNMDSYLQLLDHKTKKLVDPIIKEKCNKYPWDLVKETHKPDGAWAQIYDNGNGNRRVIPIELIKEKG